MHKKVLLINPYTGDSKGINEATTYPPLGLTYLASYLREKAVINSYDIKIIDASILEISNEELLRKIGEISPDIVGVHMNIILAMNGLKVVRMIKEKYPKILICVGGPVVSSNPRDVLKLSNADVAVIGEGEITFFEICEGKEFEKIKGVAYRGDKGIVFTEPRPLIENIDELPHPAYELLPDFKLYRSRARRTPSGAIMTSRGCPYRCTFCNANIFGKKFRAHSPEYVIEEIDLLVKKYGVKQLDILDDNFTLNIKRADKILDLIIQRKYGLKLNIQNGIRVDLINEELVKKMKKAGVFKVGIGVDSASKTILKSMKKDLDPIKSFQAIRLFRKYGIITVAFFIIGFPDDTRETINESIDFALEANPSIANFMLLIPLPGTEIHDYMKQNNLLLDPSRFYYPTGFHESKIYHKCENLTEEELQELQKKAYSKFNFRISKIIDLLYNVRSVSEAKWTLKAGTSILKNVLFKKRKSSE